MTDVGAELGKCLQWACSPRGGNNFYGRVLNGCGRRATPGLGTCGVTLDKEGRYVMLWDPDWFLAQDESFRLLVIVHEAAHLILRHIERGIVIRRSLMDDQVSVKLAEVLNVAMDMAVNDLAVRPMVDATQLKFKEHRNKLVWPEDRKYPPGLTAEDYLVLLLEDLKDHGWTPQDKESEIPQQSSAAGNPSGEGGDGEQQDQQGQQGQAGEDKDENKEGGEGGEGQPSPGNQPKEGEGKLPGWFQHLLNKKHMSIDWGKIFENMTDSEIQRAVDRARREARKIANQAAQQTKKSRGTIPGNIQSVMDDLLAEPFIPWQEVLRGQLRSAVSQKLDTSTAYPSVALLHSDGYEPYPGYQNNFTFNILAAFDTSGSMSNDDFRDCCVELRGLLTKEDGVSVRLLHFDYNIQHEVELTSDDSKDLQRTQTRYGHGGTAFDSPLRYAVQADEEADWVADAEREDRPGGPFDLMLMFTDGYAPIPLPELDPKIPLFWVLTAGGQSDDRMKTILYMED